MPAATIDEVLHQLETIIDDCIRTNNRAGYFAALYYKVTKSVKEGILKGQFEDGARMERLDVIFANRYLTAYDQWKNKLSTTGSWHVAFETAKRSRPLVLQHLLLGMNAHINLDLGIAAVETMARKDIHGISNDFNNINTVIASLTYEVIGEINRISPLLSLMGLHATNYNSILIQFSIGNARDGAWRFAEDLCKKSGETYHECIRQRDKNITLLGQSLVNASPLLRFTLWAIHLFEWKRPAKIINALYKTQKVYIKASAFKPAAK